MVESGRVDLLAMDSDCPIARGRRCPRLVIKQDDSFRGAVARIRTSKVTNEHLAGCRRGVGEVSVSGLDCRGAVRRRDPDGQSIAPLVPEIYQGCVVANAGSGLAILRDREDM